MWKIIILVVFMMLPGCASQLKVTYHSDPEGAVLYMDGKRVGYMPQVLNYNVSDESKKQGFATLANTKVLWASGASVEVKSLKADITRYGLSQQFTFSRPDGIPGRETDLLFSLELERTKTMLRQAIAQEDQAAAQLRQAVAQEKRAVTERNRNCTTTINGHMINTSCN